MESKFVLDSRGKPFKFSYEAAKNTPQRRLYNWGNAVPKRESDMLPHSDRLKIIAWLRDALRNNGFVAALCRVYGLSLGCPIIRSITGDPVYDDLKERLLEEKLKTLGYETGWNLKKLLYVINIEELIAGECFLVFSEDNKLQLIESELCGSPRLEDDKRKGESDGIVYNSSNEVVAYRFGSWTDKGTISYEKKDSTIVPAEFVIHYGSPSRVSEKRYSPKLAPAITLIHDLKVITESKIASIKQQGKYSVAITKNTDPALYAEMVRDTTGAIPVDEIFDRSVARTDYQYIDDGAVIYLEAGESVTPIASQYQSADYDSFQLSIMDRICAVIGIPTEEVVIGYRKSNYSSSRSDKLRWKSSVEYIRDEQDSILDKVQKWITENEKDSLPPSPDSNEDVLLVWPSIKDISDQESVSTNIAQYSAGLITKSQIANEKGLFSDQLDKQLIKEAAYRAKVLKDTAIETGLTVEEIQAQMPDGLGVAAFLSQKNDGGNT